HERRYFPPPLLRRPAPHLPLALRLPDSSTRPARTHRDQRHRPPHRRLGRPPTGRKLPGSNRAQVPAPRSGRHLRRRLRTAGERPGDERGPHPPRAPWQNPFVERVIGSIRRECLDHVIVINERLLRRLLRSYLAYYNAPARIRPSPPQDPNR